MQKTPSRSTCLLKSRVTFILDMVNEIFRIIWKKLSEGRKMAKERNYWFNVLDSGINGIGSENAAFGIQNTIDNAAQNGGGTVYFPPGEYLTGSLKLKSNVSLHFEAGAILLGSENIFDYEEIEGRRYLISGFNCENIAIRGLGTIHGNGAKYWKTDGFMKANSPFYGKHRRYEPKEPRPFASIHFRDSKNIHINDITMIDSACYAVWLLGCDDAKISGIRIKNSYNGPNTDGLDIDCSSNVSISDCSIDAGDDCLALKSDTNALGRIKACENINVTNCQLSSTTNGIRIGYEGDGPIKNCVFSNIVMHDCDSGIAINAISGVESKRIRIKGGTTIENIIFSDIVMDVNRAFYLWIGKGGPSKIEGSIRNIKFRNIIARITRGSYIGGCEDVPVGDVEFNGVSLNISGKKDDEFLDEVPDPLSVWGDSPYTLGLPYGFYCRRVKDISFRDIKVEWGQITGNWSSAIRCEDAAGLQISGLIARQGMPESGCPVIHLSNTKDAFITGCRAVKGSNAFLLLSGDRISSVVFCFNDTRNALKMIEYNEDIGPGAIIQHSNVN